MTKVENQNKTLLTKGIRENGTIEDAFYETTFCPLVNVFRDEDGFIRFQGDNGVTNVEIRVLISDLEKILKT